MLSATPPSAWNAVRPTGPPRLGGRTPDGPKGRRAGYHPALVPEAHSANLVNPARGAALSLLIAIAAIVASMLAAGSGARIATPPGCPPSPIFPALAEGDFAPSACLIPAPPPTPALHRGEPEPRAASGAQKHSSVGVASDSVREPMPVAHAEPGGPFAGPVSPAAMAKRSRAPPRL